MASLVHSAGTKGGHPHLAGSIALPRLLDVKIAVVHTVPITVFSQIAMSGSDDPVSEQHAAQQSTAETEATQYNLSSSAMTANSGAVSSELKMGFDGIEELYRLGIASDPKPRPL